MVGFSEVQVEVEVLLVEQGFVCLVGLQAVAASGEERFAGGGEREGGVEAGVFPMQDEVGGQLVLVLPVF